MKIAVGADHAGYELKRAIVAELERLGHEVDDLGPRSASEAVDYPDYAIPVAERVADGRADRGVVVCATGIGVSIAANKVRGVRASLVDSDAVARLTRAHNDANVLALGANTVPGVSEALGWMRTWLDTSFEGGRHLRRVNKITAYEDAHTAPSSKEEPA